MGLDSPLGGGESGWGGMHRGPMYTDYTLQCGVAQNVDGVRTIGVSFFGTDRCLLGCALFIMGLYVLPYKDGIYRAGFGAFCSAAVAAGLWCFWGSRSGAHKAAVITG